MNYDNVVSFQVSGPVHDFLCFRQRSRMKNVHRFVSISLAATALILSSAGTQAQSWRETKLDGDWGGRDRACSQGATPRPEQCNAATRGQVAVCWTNRKTGECFGATAWCTYKTVTLNTPKDGRAPGRIYECK
jgi:hypothetical protein